MLEQIVTRVRSLVGPRCHPENAVAVPVRTRLNLLGGAHREPAAWHYVPGSTRLRPRVRRTATRAVTPRLFGEVAIARGLITREHLEEALARQRVLGTRLGQTLVAMRVLGEDDVARVLSDQHGMPFIALESFIIDPATAMLVPEHIAQRHQVIPINKIGNRLSVAMVDPLNVLALDDIQIMTGLTTQALVASRAGLQHALMDVYGAQSQLDRVFGDIEGVYPPEGPDGALESSFELDVNDAPIIRLVNLILSQAVVVGASEILLETFAREFRVRYRRDGRLRTEMTPPLKAAGAILQRMKVLAQLPAEITGRAGRGTFAVRVNNRVVDMDVHLQPARHGEMVTLRIHDPRAVPEDLDALGLEREARLALAEALAARDGLVLIAGPQRSGRTTTRLAIARHVNQVARRIATVGRSRAATHGLHDVLCDPRDGRGFAFTLNELNDARPDVVLLEDIPDRATARALLDLLDAGVQVVAGLSARDAEAAIARLSRLERGLAAHLRAVSAQCLVRRLCPDCRVSWRPPADLWRRHGVSAAEAAEAQVFRAGQCDRCEHDGYRGRAGVFEVLAISPENRRALGRGRSAARARRVALEEGARPLQTALIAKVASGLTTFEELAALDRALPTRSVPAPLPPDPFAALQPLAPVPRRLALVAVTQEGLRWPLGPADTIVGQRDELANVTPEVDLARLDPAGVIAPMHLRITREGGRHFVEALPGSTGTQLNGRDLAPGRRVPLEPDDVLLLAHAVVLRAEQEG